MPVASFSRRHVLQALGAMGLGGAALSAPFAAKIESGKQKVKELNDRFADWYYVISDDVYRKIHLNHDDIVQKKKKETKPRMP